MMKIYDNFMPLPIQNQWEDGLTKGFPWIYAKESTFTNSPPENSLNKFNNNYYPSFAHVIYAAEDNYYSNYFQQFLGGMCIINDLIGKTHQDIIRIRAGLIYPDIHGRKHHNPHIDFDIDHLVALYYINDTDGDTYFFDDEKNIVNSVSPKKGRMVVFDGKQFHASSSPSDGIRVAVNINYFN